MARRCILIVAGEVSGDIHAGNLLNELHAADANIEAFGIGGDRLIAAGLECVAHADELSHMGLVEVVRELPRIRKLFHRLVHAAVARKPDLAVLVDSPDFNLRLAAKLKKHGIPVVLYISPQLWAWRRGRVRVVRRLAREVLCILPFEVDFYQNYGVDARYVGHPLVDDLARREGQSGAGEHSGGRLALMPGSRAMEVRQLLPVMLQALSCLDHRLIDDVVLLEAPNMGNTVDELLASAPVDQRLRRVGGDGRRTELQGCALAWTASGTATLECALLDVPMVVGYRLQSLSYLIAKLLVRVPHVALVNLIAGCELVPELLQGRWTAEVLCRHTTEILAEGGGRQRIGLAEVRRRLGDPGASARAAHAVLEHLEVVPQLKMPGRAARVDDI